MTLMKPPSLTELRERVLIITLNRPDQRNAVQQPPAGGQRDRDGT